MTSEEKEVVELRRPEARHERYKPLPAFVASSGKIEKLEWATYNFKPLAGIHL